jgi:hypothetical protein
LAYVPGPGGRQLLTDAGDTDNAAAIAEFAIPSAAINNARARTT